MQFDALFKVIILILIQDRAASSRRHSSEQSCSGNDGRGRPQVGQDRLVLRTNPKYKEVLRTHGNFLLNIIAFVK